MGKSYIVKTLDVILKALNVILRGFLTQKGCRLLQEIFVVSVQLYFEMKLNPGFARGDLGGTGLDQPDLHLTQDPL